MNDTTAVAKSPFDRTIVKNSPTAPIREGFLFRRDAKGTSVSATCHEDILIVIFTGRAMVAYNEHPMAAVAEQQICLIPKGCSYTLEFTEDTSALYYFFDGPKDRDDRDRLEKIYLASGCFEYRLAPVACKPTVYSMVAQLVIYLNDGINHPSLNQIKEKELFMLLFSYYSNSELLTLFYPLLGSNISFKSFVMQNYARVASVQEFADLAHCSISTFKRRFHESFGVSVYQWMLDQKSKHILHALTLENVSFADIIFEYGFSSASHFSGFCKRKFGAAPKALREQLRQEQGCCVGS